MTASASHGVPRAPEGRGDAGALDPGSDLATPEGAVGDSLSVAVWTVVSRFTGVLRGITIAAVLGVTYFANTYQFTNSLPNLIFYGLLGGSLFSSLLVPAMVGHVDSGNKRAAARTAGGLLGVALLGMLAIVPVVAVLAPWLLQLGSVGSSGAAEAHSQAHTAALLVLLLLPQVPLYAIVGTATAVMNAHRRFALAAAAPALENLGTIVILGVVAVLYSRAAMTSQHIPPSLLLLLGAGTTGAVLLHASTQWWGARRAGVMLVPNAGWRDPQVRTTLRRALPAVAQAALAALQLGALLVVADRVAGGVVAFQLAVNFYFLPIAIGATPVALSLVPRLSRMTAPGQAGLFRDTYVRGLVFASFLVVPAATAYAVLAGPLAGAIGFGAFAAADGRTLIASALLGLAPAITGETLFLVTTYACYARNDTTYPLRGMVIHAVVCGAGIAAAARLSGPAMLTGLGLAFSAGSVAASIYVVHHLRRGLPRGGERFLRPFLRTIACSAIMAVPAWAGASFVAGEVRNSAERVMAMLLLCLVGACTYFAAQACMRAPQVQWVTGALMERRRAAAMLAARAWRALTSGGRRRLLSWGLLLVPFTAGALAAVKIVYAVAALIAIGIIGWVMARPAIAAYLLIFLTPLIAGLNVAALPVLRPNEALLGLIVMALGLRWLTRVRTGEIRRPRIDRADISLIALGVTSSVLPLAMMMMRQRAITLDDLLYSIVLWKLAAEYAIVRTAVTTREQAIRCLVLSLLTAAVVCAIGIVQSLGGLTGFLAKYYSTAGLDSLTTGRGGSLLGLPAAVADLGILNLAIAVAMMVRGYPRRAWLGGLAVIYALGVVAAAEFSTFIGLFVALAALLMLTKSGRIAAYMVPVGVVGGVLLWPVIHIRLAGFHTANGLPVSWTDRLYNLKTYFWPVLLSDHNWILGVRPAARIATSSRRFGFVWIESGYTWLLWGGGIPLLASYLAFVGTVLKKSWAYARRADAAGVAATAVATVGCAQVVLMLLDPHLTYRGSGDALFLVLALVRRLPGRRKLAGVTERVAPASASVLAEAPA
ncbi:MAG TPA: lipid II flippase MurJ [Streptosporangiaceae bacterium]|nr:lipid II flippase MurJ [Streptosporangiaceae bacterium]